jgi:ion channel
VQAPATLSAVGARKVMDVYTWLVAPLGVGFLYVSVPPSEFRNGLSGLVFATVLGLFMIVLFGTKFWLDLRHADAVEGAVRELGLGEHFAFTLSNPALSWASAAVAVVGNFAYVYRGLSLRDPSAFTAPLSMLDAFYFAVATFTTTGFGDLAAVSQAARVAVMAQMVAGFALVSVGLALVLVRLRPRPTRTS